MIPISYNIRSLAVRKSTTIATAGGVALVVFVFASVLMLVDGIKRTLGKSGGPSIAVVLAGGVDAEITSNIAENQATIIKSSKEIARGPDGNPQTLTEKIGLIDGEKKDGSAGNLQLRGVPDNVLTFRPEVKIIAGRMLKPGTLELVIGSQIRGRFKGVDLNQTVSLGKDRPGLVVGVFAAEGTSYESELWGDLRFVQKALGTEQQLSSVRVRLQNPALFKAFQKTIESDKRLGLEARREQDFFEKQSEVTAGMIGALGLMTAIMFSIGSMIGATITMYSAVATRQREIGTLRALGFSKSAILTSFLIESTVLCMAGGIVGTVASLGMGAAKFATFNMASYSEQVFTFHPTPEIILASLVFACSIGLLGGFLPALRAAYIPLVEAMRG